jgi:transposase
VNELTAAVQQEAEKRPEAQLLMPHPGVGPVTALAFVLILGYPERFQCGKQIGSYVGLIPAESSSGVHRRLGTSASRVMFFYVLSSWKQHKLPPDLTPNGTKNSRLHRSDRN